MNVPATAAASIAPALRRTRDHVASALRGEGGAWMFVFKVLLSIYLSGFIAMRLALPSPSTAMITVLVVMHRQSGMVLAKSFYRAVGTLVGSVAAVAMMALFPQQPVMFLLAMATWVGLCAGGALMFRNFRSYGFVLSGYTVAIIALPAVNQPTQIFELAVSRVSEVLLGLLVSGVVFDVVFPVRLRHSLRTAARSLLSGFLEFVRDSTLGAMPREAMETAHLRFVRESMALEDLRASVVFEDPEARARSTRLRLFNQRFMAATTRFQALHHFNNRLLRNSGEALVQAGAQLYRPVGEILAQRRGVEDDAALAHRLAEEGARLPAAAQALRAQVAPERRDEFDAGVSLLQRLVDELADLLRTAAALHLPGAGGDIAGGSERVRFHYATDRAAVVVTVARSFVVTLLLGLAWMTSGWSYGAGATAQVIALTAILAAVPNPQGLARQMGAGFVLGTVAAFVCFTLVLAPVDSFAMLVLTTLPFLMVPVYLSTKPPLFGLSLGMALAVLVSLGFTLTPSRDVAAFVNNAVALLMGVGLALLAFQLMPSVIGSARQRQRLLAQLRRQVVVAAHAPLPGLVPRLESLSRDLLLQVVNHTQPGSPESRTQLAWALAVHETGRTLVELRHDALERQLPPALQRRIDAAIEAIARLYEDPRPQHRHEALQQVEAALQAAGPSDAPMAPERVVRQHLHVLRSALLDTESILAASQPVPGATSQVPLPHAR